MFLTKHTLFAEEIILYGKKNFIMKFFFTEKNFFYREKCKWKCKNIYLISEIYYYVENVCVTKKDQSFLNIYSFYKKIFFDHKKNIF